MTGAKTKGECLKPTLELKHALQAARRLRARDKAVTAYRCIACGGWHVGGTNGFKQPPRRIRSNAQLSNARI